MAFAHRIDGAWIEVAGDFVDATGAEPVRRSAQWIASATPEERAGVGLVEIVETDRPIDVNVEGSTIGDVGGVPTRTWATEPFPDRDCRRNLLGSRQADPRRPRQWKMRHGSRPRRHRSG